MKFMEETYWFKGGKIALVVMVFAAIIGSISTSGEGVASGLGLFIPILPVLWVSRLFFNSYNFDFTEHLGLFLILILAFWFAVGAIIGWLYGKFKNRNKINV
jgi:hypothetical protein